MLKRNIDIFAHLRNIRDGSDELVGKVRRIRVQDAHPLDALDLGERVQELGQPASIARSQVDAPLIRIFCDQVKLTNSRIRQRLRFVDD